MARKRTHREVADAIIRLVDFEGPSCSGYMQDDGTYVVLSYWTPMAIFDPTTRRYWINGRSYSVTTARLQGHIRTALYYMQPNGWAETGTLEPKRQWGYFRPPVAA